MTPFKQKTPDPPGEQPDTGQKPPQTGRAEKQQRRAAEKAAKAEARAFEKAQQRERRGDQEQAYVLRKNTALKAARLILWVMLAFFFAKGLAVSLRPDPTLEVAQTIETFKAEFSGYQEQDNEVLAFAENFAVNYLTYTAGQEQDYIDRLSLYASKAVTGQPYKFTAGSAAAVTYANAYRKEAYSPTQTDVWVLLEVRYFSRSQDKDGAVTQQLLEHEITILKVPVSIAGNAYVVEDLPAFVRDNIKLESYTAASFRGGGECGKETADAITLALTNFYRAYYGEAQSVINYYLAPEADQSDFVGLDGRVTFDRITALRSYYAWEGATDHFVAVLTLQVIDKNNVKVSQNFHVQLIFKDGQYYVSSMDTRSGGLSIEAPATN